MPVGLLPTPKVIQVDTRGAVILHEESPEVSHYRSTHPPYSSSLTTALLRTPRQTRDSRGIYFPNHIEPVSHIAVDVSILHCFLSASPAGCKRLRNNRTIVRLSANGVMPN